MGLIKRTVKRAVRKQARRVSVTCGTCGKRYTNPLTHTCTVKTDFRKRKRGAERKAKQEAAKARRKTAADRRKAAAAARRKAAAEKRRQAARKPPARPAHDYHTCRDPECRRHACLAYREGIADCPLPHL